MQTQTPGLHNDLSISQLVFVLLVIVWSEIWQRKNDKCLQLLPTTDLQWYKTNFRSWNVGIRAVQLTEILFKSKHLQVSHSIRRNLNFFCQR